MPCNAASLKREGKDSFAWALLACIDFFMLQGLMARAEAAAVIRGVEGGKIRNEVFLLQQMHRLRVMVVEEVGEDFILHLTQLGCPSCCKNQLFPPFFAGIISVPRAQQSVPGRGVAFIWVKMPAAAAV